MRSGVDRRMFARLLVQIYRAVNPAATLVDGILGMEGEGPGRSGTPRRLGVLAAGGKRAGGGHGHLPVAWEFGRKNCRPIGRRWNWGCSPEPVAIEGDFSPVSGFNLPVLAPLTFGPPRFQRLMRKHLVQRPVADRRHVPAVRRVLALLPGQGHHTLRRDRRFRLRPLHPLLLLRRDVPARRAEGRRNPGRQGRAQAGRPAGPDHPSRGAEGRHRLTRSSH